MFFAILNILKNKLLLKANSTPIGKFFILMWNESDHREPTLIFKSHFSYLSMHVFVWVFVSVLCIYGGGGNHLYIYIYLPISPNCLIHTYVIYDSQLAKTINIPVTQLHLYNGSISTAFHDHNWSEDTFLDAEMTP